MTNATGFLVRTSLDDTGSMPRSGTFTASPDIIPAGTAAMSRNDLIAAYGTSIDKTLTQGLTNFLYVRAKNMNSTSLNQVAYLFQVDGTLVLSPQLWYRADHLVGYDVKNPGEHSGDPDDPKIIKKYSRPLSAQPGEIVVTDAFTWAPDNTNHHCLVAVVADNWADVLKNYPDENSMDSLGQWIYNNASLGWHNVNIQPITTQIYESEIAYTHTSSLDEDITFTIVAQNVPVGARVSFAANSSLANGTVIGVDWTNVAAPAGGGANNPDFEVGTTLTVNAGYTTVITYRTDLNGLTPPDNFSMHMKATKAIPAPNSMAAAAMLAAESFAESYHRSHSPTALFVDADGNEHGIGLAGYRAMLGFDPGGGGDLDDTVVVVLGSATARPGEH